MTDLVNLGQVGWDHVTFVNVMFTVASITNCLTSFLAWRRSARNGVIATDNHAAILDNTRATRAVETNVNGHLHTITTKLASALEDKAALSAEIAELKANGK